MVCHQGILTIAVTFSAILLSGPVVRAQSTPAGPSFDAASVRPSAPGDDFIQFAVRPGRLTAQAIPLSFLISWVYEIKPGQLRAGYPKWIESERYAIAASAAPDTPVPEMRKMLQRLLAERFQLTVHEEAEVVSVWALVVDRDDRRLGPQMRLSTKCQPAEPKDVTRGLPVSDACGIRGTRGWISGKSVSVDSLVGALAAPLNAQVVDRTGLTDRFDLELKWGPLADPLIDPGLGEGLSLFTAVREQLGLRLRSEKGEGKVLVIDRVERPSPN